MPGKEVCALGQLLEVVRESLRTYVKSPVASLCFVCSSVMNLESVMMSVTIFSPPVAGLPLPLVDILVSILVAAR